MCARAGVDAVGGVTLRRRCPQGLAQLASSATRVCSRAQVLGVRGPAGGVLSPCNELPQVPAAAVEEGPQGQTGGGGTPETVAARPRAGVRPFSRARRPLCRRDRAVGAVCEDLPGRQERQACSRPGPSPGPSAVCSHPTEVSSERCAHGDMSTREGRFRPEKWDARRGERS